MSPTDNHTTSTVLLGVVAVACAALVVVAQPTMATAFWAPTASATMTRPVASTAFPLQTRMAQPVQYQTIEHTMGMEYEPSYADVPAQVKSTNAGPSVFGTVATVMSAVAVFCIGKVLGERSIAMMAVSGEDSKPKGGQQAESWDGRQSVMDMIADGTFQDPRAARSLTDEQFSRLMIQQLTNRFGASKVKRVIESWKMTERGEVFEKIHGTHPLMEQNASSYIEGLTAKPNWQNPSKLFPWAKTLEAEWETVRDELEKVIGLSDDELKAKQSLGWMGAQYGAAEAYGVEWRTLGLCDRGTWDEDNTRLFPNTCRLLRKTRVPVMEAFFAKMPAGSVIQPHSDNVNFVLTAHLGLKVPEGKCHINCGDARLDWKNGKCILMDTSYYHEARNDSDEDRYVLILRLWHPELTQEEIQAVTFIFDTLDDPEIITNPDGAIMYDMMKAHQIMEWNAILGPGDTEEESLAMLEQIEARTKNLPDASPFDDANSFEEALKIKMEAERKRKEKEEQE